MIDSIFFKTHKHNRKLYNIIFQRIGREIIVNLNAHLGLYELVHVFTYDRDVTEK